MLFDAVNRHALQDYQETERIPMEIQKKVDEFYDALDDEKFDIAKQILEELEEKTAPQHSILIQMRTRYEFETMELKE